ncbi:MAG: hypothetical protein LBU83_06590 [Bacteroidales bacterium]|jgi:hypothetical protein|nr:hypothetical protein [Bacteroidales bacterium]
MKKFLCGKVGNNTLGMILFIIFFWLLRVTTGLGGAVGGAIAGAIGFGVAALIKGILQPAEKNDKGANTNE